MFDYSIASLLPLALMSLLAFYVACNLGANDVANSMGTSVGSKALTLKQAIIVAGILEFTGAVLFGHGVSQTLATEIFNLEAFVNQPQILLIGMVSVLIASGVWLQIATSQGLPVASSHAVVGAIAGFSAIAAGVGAVDWQTIGIISLTWLITPLMSGTISALFYSLIRQGILNHRQPLKQLREWIPWLSAGLLSVFGVLVLPQLSVSIQSIFQQQWGWQLPAHDFAIAIGLVGTGSLTWVSWQQLEAKIAEPEQTISDRSEIPQEHTVERLLAQFQVLSACFVAFAHGSNDVGNTVAPLAVILHINNTGSIPMENFDVPVWILVLGGAGIVTGLAIWGKNVILTVGENIISLTPSAGFCAELATATTVLLASKLGLPVSTSHALVGGVLGIGLLQGWRSVRLDTVRSIGLAWLITVPSATALAALIFVVIRSVTVH
ncbi:anion permease [Limnoraphis robusta]|uniref:Phosphate transporter n=1 Tax=Limnoraphis robusta CCNP1315 TaxID=3110306 RepID=A0ABU5TVC6_9CYAN|nr:anion permease [Limnoraphis robusta]MEA5518764.1 inorganic phosphate transporter [Limnoraphis robusta CCNP1315]MEA5545442.1 inorganic phosphate transporter [Limnoraphis robusta CCNP1324]